MIKESECILKGGTSIKLRLNARKSCLSRISYLLLLICRAKAENRRLKNMLEFCSQMDKIGSTGLMERIFGKKQTKAEEKT